MTLPGTPSPSLVLIQILRAPGPRERSNYYSWLSWAVPVQAPGEDVDEKVDVDHEKNKDVGMGKHKKTEHRQDVAVRLDVDHGGDEHHREGCGPWEGCKSVEEQRSNNHDYSEHR